MGAGRGWTHARRGEGERDTLARTWRRRKERDILAHALEEVKGSADSLARHAERRSKPSAARGVARWKRLKAARLAGPHAERTFNAQRDSLSASWKKLKGAARLAGPHAERDVQAQRHLARRADEVSKAARCPWPNPNNELGAGMARLQDASDELLSSLELARHRAGAESPAPPAPDLRRRGWCQRDPALTDRFNLLARSH